jgi:histidyl-tRNA synthetase
MIAVNRMITPRTLKGFRDFLPDLMLPRERPIETATQVGLRFDLTVPLV